MTSIKWIGINWLFAFIITLSILVTSGLAQIQEPQPIHQAVPDKWHGPFSQFLRDLGVRDVASVVAHTKFGDIGGAHRPSLWFFGLRTKLLVKQMFV